jgi:large subunit ribosomal protein L37Ae
MATKLKKTKSAGRFGAKFGRSLRSKLVKVEEKQRQKQVCPFCSKKGIKRLANGIWFCSRCEKKFASNTYYLDKNTKA